MSQTVIPGVSVLENYPEWYAPNKDRPVQNRAVLHGLHPMGGELGPAGSTCGACEHIIKHSLNRVYYKCELRGSSSSIVTDIRVRWQGCVEYQPGGAK